MLTVVDRRQRTAPGLPTQRGWQVCQRLRIEATTQVHQEAGHINADYLIDDTRQDSQRELNGSQAPT